MKHTSDSGYLYILLELDRVIILYIITKIIIIYDFMGSVSEWTIYLSERIFAGTEANYDIPFDNDQCLLRLRALTVIGVTLI